MLHHEFFRGESSNPLVLLHGFLEDSYAWNLLETYFRDENVSFLKVDLPGFGKSELGTANSLESFADEIVKVLKHYGVSKAHLIGHSMGGYTALAFADLHPEYLASLCLFHSNTKDDSEEKKINRDRQISIVKSRGVGILAEAIIPGLFYSGSPNELTQEMMERSSSYASEGVINALQVMRQRPDRTAVLQNVNVPVLIIGGRHDALIEPKLLYDIAAGCKFCMIEVLEKSSHMGMLEQPAAAAAILLKFQRTIPSLW